MTVEAFVKYVHELLNAQPNSLVISAGFPPEELNTSNPQCKISEVTPRPIKNNDTLITEVKSKVDVVLEGKGWEYPPMIPTNRGAFFRKAMPGDNSCLFHSINYVLRNKVQSKEKVAELREIAANLVATNPDKWNSAVLGMSNSLYQHHILSPNVWGGEVELVVFSEHFEAEIVTMDYLNLHETVFGEGRGFKRRVFLLYHASESNAHYDALAFAPNAAGAAAALATDDQVVFSTLDSFAWERARHFVESLHKDAARAGRCVQCKEWKRELPKKRVTGQRLSGSTNYVGGTGTAGARLGSPASSPTARATESKSSDRMEAKTSVPASTTRMSSPPQDELDEDVLRAIEASLRAEDAKTSATNSSSSAASTIAQTSRPAAHSSGSSSSSTASRNNVPPAVSSPPVSDELTWECPACSYLNPSFPPSCEVCGTKNDLFPEDDDVVVTHVSRPNQPQPQQQQRGEWVGDTFIRAPDEVRTQRLVGGDDDVFDPSMLLTMPAWSCPRCTVRNEAGSMYCQVCQAPHPQLGLGDGVSGGSARSGQRQGWWDWLLGRSEEQWICEHCGTAQSYRLVACKTCNSPNIALFQSMSQQQQTGGSCNIA